MPYTPHPLKTVTQSEWDLLMKRIEVLEQAAQVKPSTEVAVVEKPAPRTRGTRLYEGWEPAAITVRKMHDELRVPVDVLHREHLKFMDHFLSAPGQRGVKLDWDRTWCNWMRTASEKGQLRPGVRADMAVMDEKVSGWQELGRAAAAE